MTLMNADRKFVNGELRMANSLKAGVQNRALVVHMPDIIQVPLEKAVYWSASAIEESERSVDLEGLVGEPTFSHQPCYWSKAQHIENQKCGHNPDERGDVRAAASVFDGLGRNLGLNLWGHDGRIAL
jgi:hypothetical protein